MLFNILMSSSTDKYSDRGTVWVRSCLGWHFHIDANEFNKYVHEENLEFLSVSLEQAVIIYWWLSWPSNIKHKNGCYSSEKKFLQRSYLSSRAINKKCATQEYIHRASTQWYLSRMLFQHYFLGNSSGKGHVFYFKSSERVFVPLFHKGTGIPQSPLLPIFQQSTP